MTALQARGVTPRVPIALEESLLSRLVAASCSRRMDPLVDLPWPDDLAPAGWATAPELLGAWGTDLWDDLDPETRHRLAFWEAINFFSLNIHGERTLISGLAERLYCKHTTAVTPYLHLFLEEENRHSVAFGAFCLRYGAKVYAPRSAAFGQHAMGGHADPALEDLLFFARVLVFEEIADFHNRAMQRDQRVEPISRAINAMHHRDESRHLLLGRRVVRWLWETHSRTWDAEMREGLEEHLRQFVSVVWREYYNPNAFLDAGIDDPVSAVDRAWRHPAQLERRRQATNSVLSYLSAVGIVHRVPGEGCGTREVSG